MFLIKNIQQHHPNKVEEEEEEEEEEAKEEEVILSLVGIAAELETRLDSVSSLFATGGGRYIPGDGKADKDTTTSATGLCSGCD